jgi:hypothetical protein
MINMFLGASQPVLKTFTVLAKVMENACETALLFCAKRSAIGSGEIGDPVNMLWHGFPLSIGTGRVGKKMVLVSQSNPSATNRANHLTIP